MHRRPDNTAQTAPPGGAENGAGADSKAQCPCRLVLGGSEKLDKELLKETSENGDTHWALDSLTIDRSECAERAGGVPGAPCSSKPVVDAITQFVRTIERKQPELVAKAASIASKLTDTNLLPSAPTPQAETVREAAAILHCDSESCILSSPLFVKFAEQKVGIPEKALEAEKDRRFKTPGPRNTTALLSNYNIDETMQRWARVFPEFFAMPFAMMDFDKTKESLGAHDIVDILEGRVEQDLGPGFSPVRRPARCMGCVVNTDVSSGPGKHWVAAFVDARSSDKPWTVEYFNSAGRPPPKAMIIWMERARLRLREYRTRAKKQKDAQVDTIPVTSVVHQDSQTECGLYALMYIRKRLEGAPHTFFEGQVIPDKAMVQFRQHIFRKA